MDIIFEKEYLRELFENGQTNDKKHRFQPEIIKRYAKCVKTLDEIIYIEELFKFNSLNYEKLSRDKKGLSSIRINKQFRLEFREIPNQNSKTVIEICSLVDITNHYK